MQCADEWADIRYRFKKEGIDFDSMKPEEHIILIWRWLGDCEINLKNSRRMFDKLREQQHEEIEEMENYISHIRESTEKQTADLENEVIQLRQQIQSIATLVCSTNNSGGNTVLEKITSLIKENKKYVDQLNVINNLKLNMANAEELISEIIKVTSEKEALNRNMQEMTERTQLLHKYNRELELDKEKLIFKLSEAFTELEEKEVRLGELTTMCSAGHMSFNFTRHGHDSNKSSINYVNPDLNENSEKSSSDLVRKDGSVRVDSAPSSLLISEMASFSSQPKFSNLMDSCHELARLEENKKLQSECESLKSELSNLGEKYNNLALKCMQLKSKKKYHIEELRGRLEASQCQMETLQSQLSVQRQRIRAEEIFRKQVESDLRRLQEEKRNITIRLMNVEMEYKECNREVTILQKKVSMLDSSNSELLGKLLRLKYKEPSIPKNLCDNILSIGSV